MRKSDFSRGCVFEVFSLVLVVHLYLFYSVLRCNDRRMTFQWVLDGSFWSFITKNRACSFICTGMRSFAQKASRNYSGFNDCIRKLHAILHTFSLKNLFRPQTLQILHRAILLYFVRFSSYFFVIFRILLYFYSFSNTLLQHITVFGFMLDIFWFFYVYISFYYIFIIFIIIFLLLSSHYFISEFNKLCSL